MVTKQLKKEGKASGMADIFTAPLTANSIKQDILPLLNKFEVNV